MQKLLIDKDFYNLTVPKSKEEQEYFEQSMLRDGCLEPIITWEGVIIDGHKRYLFCKDEEIECRVQEVYFSSKEKAIAWVCRRRVEGLQAGTPICKYLYGKWFNCLKPAYQKMVDKGVIDCPRDSNGRGRIAKIIAKDLGFTFSYVETNQVYANHVDKIARSDPDIFQAMMAGKIKVTVKEVRALSHGDTKVRRTLIKRMRPKTETRSDRGRSRKMEEDEGVLISTKIKEMPAFDPDMEIRGLALTIPTWMAAIARAENKTDMGLATDYAKKQLADRLIRLDEQIQETLEAIGCTEKAF